LLHLPGPLHALESTVNRRTETSSAITDIGERTRAKAANGPNKGATLPTVSTGEIGGSSTSTP
jgi:hypothetical protein